MKPLRISILTQNDIVAIPNNIYRLILDDKIEVVSVFTISGKGDVKIMLFRFILGFGIFQMLKLSYHFFLLHFKDFSYLIFKSFLNLRPISIIRPISIKSICKEENIFFKQYVNLSSKKIISYLESKKIDVLVSFSTPIKLDKELLNTAKHGGINLHCSLLPKYSGLLPSFWTQYFKEKKIGCTIHQMDKNIDTGKILGQEEIDNSIDNSIFENIILTKKMGGVLMNKVLRNIQTNNVIQLNQEGVRSYFSWPSIKQIKEFKKSGGRLI